MTSNSSVIPQNLDFAQLFDTESVKLQRENAILVSTTETATKLILSLQAEIRQLKSCEKLNTEQIKRLENENDELRAAITDHEDYLTTSKSNEKILQEKLFVLENKNLILQRDYDDLQVHFSNFNSHHTFISHNQLPIQDLEKQIFDLRNELEVKDSDFQSQRKHFLNKIKKVDKENRILTDKCVQLELAENILLTKFLELENELHTKSQNATHHLKPEMVSVGVNVNIQAPSDLSKPKMVSVGTNVKIPEGNKTKTFEPNGSSHTVEKTVTPPTNPKVSKPKKFFSHEKRVYSRNETKLNPPFVKTTYGKNGEITGFRDQYGWFAYKPKQTSSKKPSVGPRKTPFAKVDLNLKTPRNSFSKQGSHMNWTTKTEFSSRPTSSKPFKYSFKELLSFKPRPVSLAKPTHFQTPLLPRKPFSHDTSCIKPPWNAFSINQIDRAYKRYGKTNFKPI